mgnify:CR=1 FL=1
MNVFFLFLDSCNQIITSFFLVITAILTSLFAIRQVKINNVTKYKLDQLSNLRKYFASFLLRSNSSDVLHIDEVKQNLYSILANLDNSSQSDELYNAIIEYLAYLKDHSYDEDKIVDITKKARCLFSNQWNDIIKGKF